MRRKLRVIQLYVPDGFLEEFDRLIEGFYPSRGEAIRVAMMLLVERLRGRQRAEASDEDSEE